MDSAVLVVGPAEVLVVEGSLLAAVKEDNRSLGALRVRQKTAGCPRASRSVRSPALVVQSFVVDRQLALCPVVEHMGLMRVWASVSVAVVVALRLAAP